MTKKQEDPSEESPPEGKRAGGRTITRWKQAVFQELPQGTPEDIATRINDCARDAGCDYHCTPDLVTRWQQADAQPKPLPLAPPNGQAAHRRPRPKARLTPCCGNSSTCWARKPSNASSTACSC